MPRVALLIVVLASLLCIPWLDRPFSSRGEPREALVAQSMVATGNWVSPPAYDGAVPSKPPFCHWLMSVASLPGGKVTEATCRIPSAIAFVLFMYGFFVFVSRRTSLHTATTAALFLLTSFEWLKAASSCRVDTILATSMAGALLALYRWDEQDRRGFPFCAALLISIAALTKGPVGIVLPLGVWGLFNVIARDALTVGRLARVCRDGLMIALPVVFVVSLWYVAGYFERGDEFIAKIRYENFERFTSTMEDEPHKHSVFYLFGMLAVGLLPWSFFWVVAAGVRWRDCWAHLRSPRQGWFSIGDFQRFSIVAAAVIVIFFCIPSSKRSVYLLPAYPFIALVAAEGVSRWLGSVERMVRGLAVCSKWLCVVPILVCVVMVVSPGGLGLPQMRDSIIAALSWWKIILLVAALALLWWPLRAHVRDAASVPVGTLALWVLALVVSLNIFVVDGVMAHLSPKRWVQSYGFGMSVEPATRDRFFSFGSEMYATSFYLQKPFYRAGESLPADALVVLEARQIEKLQSTLGVKTREISRFTPGIDNRKSELAVVEILSSANGE
jgi:4-amino-4-deoxy-L-arabinose transferase-like glycosyltransferase